MQKFTDEEIQSMSLGKAIVPFESAILECVSEYILDLERNDKIKNATKLLYHLRDEVDALLRANWSREK